jgi:ribonuclease HII
VKVTNYPDLVKEMTLLKQGHRFVAGLDEAGRGAWAGPVVAAAVILPLHQPEQLLDTLTGLHDSKLVSPKKRDYLFEVIQNVALAVAVGTASSTAVDQLNVVKATQLAMQQAITTLSLRPDFLLLDHIKLPAEKTPQESFPKADQSSLTVAAASVIAKVTRDRFMVKLHDQYPEYAFAQHKGYGTRAHRAALAQHGPCPYHRFSYQPVSQLSLFNR